MERSGFVSFFRAPAPAEGRGAFIRPDIQLPINTSRTTRMFSKKQYKIQRNIKQDETHKISQYHCIFSYPLCKKTASPERAPPRAKNNEYALLYAV
jgi:hypothetical protein